MLRIKVLVCGGRDFADKDRMAYAFAEVQKAFEIAAIIQGEARGADLMAKAWAVERGIPTMDFPADWDKHGKSAGHIRNNQMLVEGKPDLVLAFLGGKGTANMVASARKAGVRVILC